MRFILTTSILLIFVFVNVSSFAAAVRNLREGFSMEFGTIVVDPTGDVVTLQVSGNRISQNSSFFMGLGQAAQWNVQGDKNTAAFITFSASTTLSGPGVSMTLNNFQHDQGATPVFNAQGKMTFNVGADLIVNSSQVSGSYSGTYLVTVDYP